ncbi:hypothetical protein V5799_020300 [Amblyomma americanum]|uniref:Uncharacterized protein n=1 Tax=Amblyomma americanum TaxID=6943 RepID=A0AAQ4EUG4_AMBAM
MTTGRPTDRISQRSVYLTSKEAFTEYVPPTSPPGPVVSQTATVSSPVLQVQQPLHRDLYVTANATALPPAIQRSRSLFRPAAFQSSARAAAKTVDASAGLWSGAAAGADKGEPVLWFLVTMTYLIGSIVALGLAVAYIVMSIDRGHIVTSDHSDVDFTLLTTNASLTAQASMEPTALARRTVASASYDTRTLPTHAEEMSSPTEGVDV